MRLSSERALFDLAPLVALLVTAAVWIAGIHDEAPPAASQVPVAMSGGIDVTHGRHRFVADDIPLVVAAVETTGVTTFICWIDPVSGNLDLVTDPDRKPHLDLKPGSCPNSVNVNAGAAVASLPGGLLGNDFDVTQVDLSTLHLSLIDTLLAEQVSPIHTSFEDVGTPFEGTSCQCHALGGDGLLDLVIHFDLQEVADAFGLHTVPNDTLVPMRVTGMVTGGRAIFGTRDCIRVVNQ